MFKAITKHFVLRGFFDLLLKTVLFDGIKIKQILLTIIDTIILYEI